MRHGNCLTAALRKRRLGVLVMVWCANRMLPHFSVRVGQSERLDVRPRPWRGTIRFLGDEAIGLQGPQKLWYAYEDVVKEDWPRRAGLEVRR